MASVSHLNLGQAKMKLLQATQNKHYQIQSIYRSYYATFVFPHALTQLQGVQFDCNLHFLSILLSGLTSEASSGDMKRMKHFVTICLLGLLLLEVSHKQMQINITRIIIFVVH
jgi:hypothetical protein